jgi:hypothetical protein
VLGGTGGGILGASHEQKSTAPLFFLHLTTLLVASDNTGCKIDGVKLKEIKRDCKFDFIFYFFMFQS